MTQKVYKEGWLPLMQRRWLRLFIVSIVSISLGSACGNDQQTKVKAYKNDGLLGISNTNPNLPTSPSYHNYNKDIGLMDKTITGIAGVRGSSIFISGANAYIKLQARQGIPQVEFRRIEKEAVEALSYMVPRYKFFITIVPISARG